MISLLALIGLIFLLWYASKALNKVGKFFDRMAETFMDDRFSYSMKTRRTSMSKKIKEKINTVKGQGTDKEYWDQVKGEIDELTGGNNEK